MAIDAKNYIPALGSLGWSLSIDGSETITTDMTCNWNTVLWDAGTDTTTVTWIATFNSAIDISTESTTITTIDAQNGTPTIAQLLTGIIFHNSKTWAGTITFPTGTAMSSGISTLAVWDSFDVFYNNYGNQTVTLTWATGSTIKGTAAVTTGLNATIKCVNTGANTWDLCCVVSA